MSTAILGEAPAAPPPPPPPPARAVAGHGARAGGGGGATGRAWWSVSDISSFLPAGGSGPVFGSVGVAHARHGEQRPHQDHEIQPQRPFLDILQVALNLKDKLLL